MPKDCLLHCFLVANGSRLHGCLGLHTLFQVSVPLIEKRQVIQFKAIQQIKQFFGDLKAMHDVGAVLEADIISWALGFDTHGKNLIRVVLISAPFWAWVNVFRMVSIHIRILLSSVFRERKPLDGGSRQPVPETGLSSDPAQYDKQKAAKVHRPLRQ